MIADSKTKKTPIQQKAKLFEQLKDIKNKIADFDDQRAKKIATLAKRYKLIDLSNAIIEKEFKTIRDRYKKELNTAHLDVGKKNS